MIGKYLDVCTSHLTQNTINQLEKENIEGVFSYDYPEGMFIVVPDWHDLRFIPDDLHKLFDYAESIRVSLIRLDRDGEEIDELPVYNWGTPKDKFLEMSSHFQQTALMETAMRIQDTADFLRYTGDIAINEDEMKLLQIFTDMAREFEYKYFGTDRYSSDFLKLTDEVFRKELLERYGKEK